MPQGLFLLALRVVNRVVHLVHLLMALLACSDRNVTLIISIELLRATLLQAQALLLQPLPTRPLTSAKGRLLFISIGTSVMLEEVGTRLFWLLLGGTILQVFVPLALEVAFVVLELLYLAREKISSVVSKSVTRPTRCLLRPRKVLHLVLWSLLNFLLG